MIRQTVLEEICKRFCTGALSATAVLKTNQANEYNRHKEHHSASGANEVQAYTFLVV